MKLFIFGSTGNLVRRKIVPAFVSLNIKGLEIIALGRKEFTDQMYHEFVCDDDCFKNFEVKPKYQKVEFGEEIICEKCDQFLEDGEENFFYSALPPKQLKSLLSYVGGIRRTGYKVNVLVEKPFGYSLSNALELKSLAGKYGLLGDLFVSDHYLYKKEILSLKPRPFKKIRLVSLESVGLEKRVSYYDEIGALKDMIQSHFLNVIFKLGGLDFADLTNITVRKYIRAQYGNGKDSGYVKDLGHSSSTETFVALSIKSGDKTFDFITGKRFDKKLGFIEMDGEKINFSASNNDYSGLFTDFFAKKTENFATVEQSIWGWDVIEKLDKHIPSLKYYQESSSAEEAALGKDFFSD